MRILAMSMHACTLRCTFNTKTSCATISSSRCGSRPVTLLMVSRQFLIMDIFDKIASFSSMDSASQEIFFDDLAGHLEIDILTDFFRFVTNEHSGVIVDNQFSVCDNLHRD